MEFAKSHNRRRVTLEQLDVNVLMKIRMTVDLVSSVGDYQEMIRTVPRKAIMPVQYSYLCLLKCSTLSNATIRIC